MLIFRSIFASKEPKNKNIMKTKELENRIENVTEKNLCPICNAELKSPQYACMRYPNHVGQTCSRKTTDINGRHLKFYNP